MGLPFFKLKLPFSERWHMRLYGAARALVSLSLTPLPLPHTHRGAWNGKAAGSSSHLFLATTLHPSDASVGSKITCSSWLLPPLFTESSTNNCSFLQSSLCLALFVWWVWLVSGRNKRVPLEGSPARPFQALTAKPMFCEAGDCHVCTAGLFNNPLPTRAFSLPVPYNHCTL